MDNRVESFIEQPKESARLVPEGRMMNVGGVLRADLEMEDVLSCRLVEIDKAQAPAGLAARLHVHGQIPQSQSPGPILTHYLRWERSQGLPMISTLYFQLQRHGLLEKE